jgi:quercetin dioxygenase-like cupin family protein
LIQSHLIPEAPEGATRDRRTEMLKYVASAAGLAILAAAVVAQTEVVLGDRTSPLRPLGGDGNTGISNAVLRDQPEVRSLRVVVEAGGTRAMHAHSDVQFHLFVPISGSMEVRLDGDLTVDVQPWHTYYLAGGTQHGFHNSGDEAVEVMEIFVR